MEKTATYVTTFDDSKVNESIHKIMEYCKHNQLNLKVVIQTNLEKIAFEPEKLVNDLKEHRCDIVVSDDINLMFPDVEDFRVTFLEELKRNGIECIHTDYGRPMLEMAHYVNMKRSEELSGQASNVKSLIVYKGFDGYKDEPEYLEMEEYVGSNLDSGEVYGVLYYQNESKEIFNAMRNIIANNPIEEVVLKEAFTTEEGIDFMSQMKMLGIELYSYDDIKYEMEQKYMPNELIYSNEKDPSLNTVYYGIAKQLLNELFEKGLISQAEFYEIDDLNRRSFFQEISSEN